jgi:Na+/H+ antiporter NhaD/arsenite permease-like protein
VLIALRNTLGLSAGIWQIMLGGAVAVLVTGQITPNEALQAINMDIILFLFGMFIVGEALWRSGALLPLSYRVFCRAMTLDTLVLLLIVAAGLLSAVLMNDTVAIIGTPFVIHISRKYGISIKMLLLILAFAVTTGSVMSPIGNPQNLLIAIGSGMQYPFLAFLRYLCIPTLASLLLIYCVVRYMFREEFSRCVLSHEHEPPTDERLAKTALFSLGLIILMIVAKTLSGLTGAGPEISLTAIALAAALPVVALSPRRGEILRSIDWHTLIFFASMFVLMQSVWDAGVFQSLLNFSSGTVPGIPSIMALSILLSQIISNFPFVALFLPLLADAGAPRGAYLALAAGSTIAGNLLILGAASNVIIIQNAEKQGHSISFMEFAKIGIPLTIGQTAVYILSFGLLS